MKISFASGHDSNTPNARFECGNCDRLGGWQNARENVIKPRMVESRFAEFAFAYHETICLILIVSVIYD